MDEIFKLIEKEKKRQENVLRLIPSENYASPAVRRAVGSILMNKYSEGYPGKRYYQGQKYIDQIEELASQRAKKLFKVPYVNVQAYSGSPANAAVYFALLEPGDKIMGLKLAHGGHLTHGHPKITFSGKYFQSVQYGVEKDGWIDYDKLAALVKREKPKMIVAGTTAYPRILNWKKFAQISDSVGAYLLVDIAHIVGLVIAGVHPLPVPYAHVVTTTTHKTLRGPRGAIILITKKGLRKDPEMAKKIDRAVFPGLQGGPHINTIAGIAIALREAQSKKYIEYGQQVVKNAKVLAQELIRDGFHLVSGGTDNHLMLVDLRKQGIGGREAAVDLEKAGIVVNKNTVPYDTGTPVNPSGIRLGTPAVTTRGMKEKEMKLIGQLIAEVLLKKKIKPVRQRVLQLCQKFPLS